MAVAMLASTLLVSSPAAAAQIKRSGTTIEITGFIMPGDAVQFANLIESMKNGSTVILNSPGGALDNLIDIGHLVRDRGFTTKVPEATFCFSGCALIWLAVVKREIGFGGAVGFHSATKGRGRSEEGNIKTMVYLTAIDMSRDIIDMAVAADPSHITILNPDGARSLGLISNTSTAIEMPAVPLPKARPRSDTRPPP